MDVLANNALAGALHGGFTQGSNLSRVFFLDPAAPEFYADWDRVAPNAVAALRATAGADLEDPRLIELVGELSLKSEEFRRLWPATTSTTRPAAPNASTTPSSAS